MLATFGCPIPWRLLPRGWFQKSHNFVK